MTRNPILATLSLSLGLALPASALAEGDAERLNALLEPLDTYVADFEQRILDGDGERLQEARGRMWLSRPGKFRWEVDAPYQQEVVSDGEALFLYDPDLEQVTVQSLDQRVTHTPALLLSGSADELTENYDVSMREDGDERVFTLVPRGDESLFEELAMRFRDETLDGLHMTDSTGQETAILFDEVRMNASIEDARFTFEIPDGADVIRENE